MRRIYMCTCRTEGISVESVEFANYPTEIEFAIFYRGEWGSKWPFWERVKYCFEILRRGKPFSDQVILSTSEAACLANDILQLVEGNGTGVV